MKRPASLKRWALLGALFCLSCLRGGGPASQSANLQHPGHAPRLALLVGISEYDQRGDRPWRKLNTHRDIAQMKEVLQRHLGFEERNILTLEDAAATAAGIRKAFRTHLIERAVPGAVVVFHFSGHGQQIPDDNGDELDGLDESLVPQDAPSQLIESSVRSNIRDDEVGTWLRALQSKMQVNGKVAGSINVFLDSCYSGTATRGLLIERGRGWDENLDGARPKPRPASQRTLGADFLPADDAESQGYVVISAAQSDQTAKEFGGMGAFTRALVAALSQASATTTYRALHDRILVDVASRVRDQNPELQGPRDNLLFSGVARPVSPYLLVTPLGGDELSLPAGELHGATANSRFAIHRAGSATLGEATLIAEAVIEKVEPFTSTARLAKPFVGRLTTEQLTAARAVETQHAYPDARLLVHISGLDDLPALRGQLEGLDVLTVQGASASDYQIQIARSTDRTRLELRRPESATAFARVPLDDEAFSRLEQILRGEWRWLFLLRLQQQNPYVQATLRFVPARAPSSAAGSNISLQEGEVCSLEIRNDTVNDIYATILELGQDGSVSPIFPSVRGTDDNLLPGGKTVRLPFTFQVKPPFGRTQYKVIATADKIDFSSLVYTASRAGRSSAPALTAQLEALPSRWNALGQLLAVAGLGHRALAPIVVEPQRWGVTDASLEVRPRGN